MCALSTVLHETVRYLSPARPAPKRPPKGGGTGPWTPARSSGVLLMASNDNSTRSTFSGQNKGVTRLGHLHPLYPRPRVLPHVHPPLRAPHMNHTSISMPICISIGVDGVSCEVKALKGYASTLHYGPVVCPSRIDCLDAEDFSNPGCGSLPACLRRLDRLGIQSGTCHHCLQCSLGPSSDSQDFLPRQSPFLHTDLGQRTDIGNHDTYFTGYASL